MARREDQAQLTPHWSHWPPPRAMASPDLTMLHWRHGSLRASRDPAISVIRQSFTICSSVSCLKPTTITTTITS